MHVVHLAVAERQAEQGILSPIPIRLDLPGSIAAQRVLVSYRLHGLKHWTTLELNRTRAQVFEGAIPCLEVSTVTGDVLYYLRVHDFEGAVVAYSGSRHDPYRVRIIHDSVRPDLVSATRCPDPADCPLGLPGCPSERVGRAPCKTDRDCEGELSCGWDGYCEAATRPANWLSLQMEQDFGIVSAAGACSIASQENEGYACYRQTDGANYLGNPVYTNEPLAIGMAPTRVIIGYERLTFYDVGVAVRLGYAFAGGGPTLPGAMEFFPFSVEVRVMRYFGHDPLARRTIRPFAFLAAGLGGFDTKTTVRVREDVQHLSSQSGNDLEQTLDVWKRAGDAYLGLGAGADVALDSYWALSSELAIVQVFPFDATVMMPRAGLKVGF
jgi:hypothetical protein